MNTLFVTLKLPQGTTRAQYMAMAQAVASKFQGVPGLVRKNFIYSGEAGLGGGVYTWESRELAEKFHAPGGAWHAGLTERFGTPPSVQWFDSPVIVDNRAGKIEVTA